MVLSKTSKNSKESSKDIKRSRSVSSRSSHSSRSRSRSQSSRSSSSSASSRSSSSASRSRSRSASTHSSRSSSSRDSGYKRRFHTDAPKHSNKVLPTARPTRLYIGRLTRNVNKDHVHEIFSSFGKVLSVDVPMDRVQQHLNRGFAYVEYENSDDAEKAVKYMDGGQIDGQEVSASKIDLQKARGSGPIPPPRRSGPGWRQPNSPPRRRRTPPPRRRSRSRTPPRDRRRRDSHSSSRSSSR